jgi:hypothetical protein
MYDFNATQMRRLLWAFRLVNSLLDGIGGIVDRRAVEGRVVSVKASGQDSKPAPQWRDISKPDTRGGGGGSQKK